MLPQAPLAARQVLTVSIQNFTTNTLVMSDPAVNSKDVGVQVRETVPGRNFNFVLTFPEGFGIAQGEQVAFSVKSSFPNYPVIKVPIMQSPPPANPQISTPAASQVSPSQPAAKQGTPSSLPLPLRAATQ
jgi:hypothetical protein